MSQTLIVGCGYLGRRVGRLLAARGGRVLGTVRSERSAASLPAWGIEPVLADVMEPASLADLPDVDRVVYCVGFDRTAGVPMRSVYVDGLGRVLDRLRRPERLVYVSSTGVYGQDVGGWVDETSPTEPKHESGRVCLGAEDLLRSFAADRGWDAVILRFAGLYGPGRIVRRTLIERGEPIVGDPDKFLNVIHIDDAASAVVSAFDASTPGSLYVASDDRPVPRREYYGLVARHLGAPEPCFVRPEPGSPEARRDESNKRVANRRMKAELGVRLQYPDVTTGIPAALSAADTP